MKRQAAASRTLPRYRAYLVRLWQDSPHSTWRAAAQSVQSGETVRFADLAQLFAFLQAQTTAEPPAADSAPLAAEQAAPPNTK